jgi:hypothetical protein
MITKIKEFVNPIWLFLKKHRADIILAIGVVLISFLSFAVGYISAKEQGKEPIIFEENLEI